MEEKLHNTALIFSGGGSRFGYYMGMYGALCDLRQQPDIIFASCGGSLIAGLISLYPEPQMAKRMLLSKHFYEMICRIKSQKPQSKSVFLTSAIKRYVASQYNKTYNKTLHPISTSINTLSDKIALPKSMIDNLYKKSMSYIDNESVQNTFWQSEHLLSALQSNHNHSKKNNITAIDIKESNDKQKTSTVIVASRTIPHGKGFLWQQILRCDDAAIAQQLQELQDLQKITSTVSTYSANIHTEIHISEKIPLSVAIRASINDMFYFPPLQFTEQTQASLHQTEIDTETPKKSIKKNNHEKELSSTLLGGIIDLLPIEIASALANTVYIENKSAFEKLTSEPAIHSVFGMSANKRREDCEQYIDSTTNIKRIDTRDNISKIPPVLKRAYNLLNGDVDISYPSYDEYVSIIKSQYCYGYDKVMQTQFS